MYLFSIHLKKEYTNNSSLAWLSNSAQNWLMLSDPNYVEEKTNDRKRTNGVIYAQNADIIRAWNILGKKETKMEKTDY